MTMDNYVLILVNSLQKQDRRRNFMVANMKAALADAGRARDRRRDRGDAPRAEAEVHAAEQFRDLRPGHVHEPLQPAHRRDLHGHDRDLPIGLVGGAGVMNIMLVSVTERTREIGRPEGPRRDPPRHHVAVPDRGDDLTGAGGLIGILIGAVAALLINTFSPFPAVIQPTWVIVAFATSMIVGMTFGMWPAAKAAKLDPIEALRYE
ncbi:MAG: hypothetical protein U0599_28005 [Vicinamibacteria bacterium]